MRSSSRSLSCQIFSITILSFKMRASFAHRQGNRFTVLFRFEISICLVQSKKGKIQAAGVSHVPIPPHMGKPYHIPSHPVGEAIRRLKPSPRGKVAAAKPLTDEGKGTIWERPCETISSPHQSRSARQLPPGEAYCQGFPFRSHPKVPALDPWGHFTLCPASPD